MRVMQHIDPIEQENDARHRAIAARVRQDPALVAEARSRIQRWIARDGGAPDPVLLEWEAVLEFLSPQQIADFLESPLPRARRLRSSSPFPALPSTHS